MILMLINKKMAAGWLPSFFIAQQYWEADQNLVGAMVDFNRGMHHTGIGGDEGLVFVR